MRLLLLALLLVGPALAQPTAPRFDDLVMITYGGAHTASADYERQVHPALALRAGFGLEDIGILFNQRTTTSVSVRALGTVGADGPAFQAGPGLTFVSGRQRPAGEGVSQTQPLVIVPMLSMGARFVLSGGQAPGGGPASPPDLAIRLGGAVAYDRETRMDRFGGQQPSENVTQRGLRFRPEVSIGMAF